MWKLQIVDEEGQRSEVALDRDEVTIGRRESNTIRLPERNVSREHAKLVRDSQQLFIEDIGSSFGTKVNGAKLSGRRELSPGDEVRIGDYHLLIWYDRDTDVVAVPELDDDGVYQVGRARLVPQSERCRLVVTAGRLSGVEFTLDRTPLHFGSSEDAGIRVDESGVGEDEATFTYESGTYFVAEQGSYARVRVNDEIVQSAALRPGDEIEVGGVAMRLLAPDEEWAPAAITAPATDSSPADVGNPSNLGKFAVMGLFSLGVVGAVAYFMYYNQPAPELRKPALPIAEAPPSPNQTGVAGTEAAGAATGAEDDDRAAVAAADRAATTAAAAKAEAEADRAADAKAAAAQRAEELAKLEAAKAERFEALVAAGNVEFSQQNWDGAVAKLDEALTLISSDTEVIARRDQAAAEKRRKTLLQEVQAQLDRDKPADAWKQIEGVEVSTASAYYADTEKMKVTAAAAYAAALVATGRKILPENPAKAMQFAKQALDLPGEYKEAKQLWYVAKRAEDDRRSAASAAASAQTPTSNTPRLPEDAGETKLERAKTLYLQARTAQMKNNYTNALTLYNQSAEFGVYAMPHKQLGILYAQRGDVKSAIKHYQKYLKMAPSAPDSDAVRYAIERLTNQR